MDANQNPVNTDFKVNDTIEDTISCLKFFPDQTQGILASAGWDAKIRVWSVQYSVNMNNPVINTRLNCSTTLQDPVLNIAWRHNTPAVFAGCCDGTINMYDITSNQTMKVGAHEKGAQGVIFINENNANLLVSGGWDGKLCIWDLKSDKPAFTYNLPKKVVSMSCTFPLLVVGMSERVVCYFNLLKMGQNFQPDCVFESHLKYATTVVSCFNEPNGYAIGSIEGRTAIKHLNLQTIPQVDNNRGLTSQEDFAFRCHRQGENNNLCDIYPVNALAFNPVHGTFCTGGGDGTWLIWDKDSKTKLRTGIMPNKAPITAMEYSADGNLLAYATGYDWHKGYQGANSVQPELRIHYLPDSDKKKKPKLAR